MTEGRVGADVWVARLSQLHEGRGFGVEVDGRPIALFRHRGRVHAIDGTCPHTGGPLGEGWVEDGCVECPWHGWRFELETGASPLNPALAVSVLSVRVAGDDVYVTLL